MSETKHTPGAWLITEPENRYLHISSSPSGFGDIATVWRGNVWANARLITSAPDMLAALKAIIDRSENGELGTSKVVDMRNIARAAIAKAEGR